MNRYFTPREPPPGQGQAAADPVWFPHPSCRFLRWHTPSRPDGFRFPGLGIYAAAYDVKDFRTMQFLDWFVKEQLEEEKNAEDLIKKMELFGNDSKGLYSLDAEYAQRIYTAPSLVLD